MGNFQNKDDKTEYDKIDDKTKYLDINNKINVIIKTKINSEKLDNIDKKKIKDYIKPIIENMGAGSYDYISNYIFIKKIILNTNDKKLSINITINIDKKGKKYRAHSGKKLKINELKNKCTLHNLEEHIIWSLNESSYRGDPLKLSKNKFTLSKNKIYNIDIT